MLKRLLSRTISGIKGEDYAIDPCVPSGALLSLVLSRALGLARGVIKCVGTRSVTPLVFAGRGTSLRNRRHISIGRGVTIGRHAYLDGLSREGLKIGDNVSIGPYVSIECTGNLRTLGRGCVIGSRSGIGAYSFIGAAGGVQIGSDVIMGQWVSFHSENHNFDDPDVLIRTQGVSHRGVIVEDDCWIGAKVTFLDGAHVGRGSVIGAGSVVRGDIPPYSVAAGVPARVIKSRRAE